MKWYLLTIIATALISFSFVRRGTNNVCKTFEDYYTNRDQNKNCFYNPDHELEVPDIIKRHGYPVETHYVTTEDGYILTLFRIPQGKGLKTKPGKPVLVLHGLCLNAGAFVTLAQRSFGFALADADFDVWLGNFRGSKYSRNHTHLNTGESKFWDFSFHEHGIYDVAAKVNYINQVTRQKLIYIGFSMGTTAGFVYSIVHSETAAEKIEVAVNLAPGIFSRNLTRYQIFGFFWTHIKGFIQFWTNGSYTPSLFMSNILYKYICFPFPIQMKICQLPMMFMLGYNYEQNDPETLPINMEYNLDATSIRTVSHYVQEAYSGNFEQYDYGIQENKKIYGSPEPPHYDISKIKVPQYLVYAPNDRAVTKENVELLHQVLPDKTRSGIYRIKDDNFNHFNIVMGKDAKTLVYEPVISFLNNFGRKYN